MMGMTSFAVALVVTVVIVLFHSVYGKEFSDHREIDVQKLMKQFNKPALKSIKSEDGDMIDCVPVTSQPALDHPLLKNHTIQMKPRFIPEVESKYTKKEKKTIAQVWHKNGECPKNSVPIRRTKQEDFLRAKSIKSFGRKTQQSIPQDSPSQGHEYAIMNSRDGKFYGTQFSVSIWNPSVQVREEFSLSQTWLVSGEGANLNTIEAGWQVSEQIYKDYNTRLFVYWTRDNYQTTRCYNLECPDGFVQMSNRISVTGSLDVSQYDAEQHELSMLIWKDGENWWLKIGEELVGYWPGKLFTSLGDGATKVQWGGEIVNNMVDGRHTTTDMGSGHFAEEGPNKASYFKNLMIIDETNTLREPEGLYPHVSKETCYNLVVGNGGTTSGSYFYYGGPGQNDNCP